MADSKTKRGAWVFDNSRVAIMILVCLCLDIFYAMINQTAIIWPLFHSAKPDAVTIFEGNFRYRFLARLYHFLDCLFIVVEKKENERGREKDRTWYFRVIWQERQYHFMVEVSE